MSSKISNIITKFLLGILVFLMIAGVAVWGLNDIATGNRNTTVAKVGNSVISEYELESHVQNRKMQLSQSGLNNISEEFKTVLRNNVLVNLIGDRLLQNEFNKLRIELDEKQVLKQDYLSQPGFDKERLKAIAQSQGGEEAFLKRITKEKKIDILQGSITAITPVNEAVAKAIFNFENQTKDIEYVELDASISKVSAEPSEDELKAFYESNKELFLTPEYRSVSYVLINEKAVHSQSGDEDLIEQLHEISGEILDKVAGGGTLEEVAKDYDLEIKQIKLIDTEGRTVDGNSASLPKVNNFLSAVFGTEQEQISDILESDDGKSYALLRVDTMVDKKFKDLSEVKSQIVLGYKTQKSAEKLVDVAKNLKVDLDSGKTTLAKFAEKNSIVVKQKTALNLKSNSFPPEFIKEIFDLPKGKFSNINKTNNGSLIIAGVTNINNSKAPQSLDLFEYNSKIKEQVSQEIMAQYLDYLKGKYRVKVYSK